MKKGFTLIELAIVLVVIGLLLGMAFKGKSLVDAARIKSDINKMSKIGAGISAYYAKYNKLPGISGNVTNPKGGADLLKGSPAAFYQSLISEGVLTESDFKLSNGNFYWGVIGCEHNNQAWKESSISENVSICIYPSTSSPIDAIMPAFMTQNANVTGVIVCRIETMLDDKSLTSGDGRLVSTANIPKIDADWNCGNTLTTGSDTAPVKYLYRIF